MKQAMCTQAPCKHAQFAGVMIPRVMDIPVRQKCREQHPHCRHSPKDKQSPSSPALAGTWDSPSWVTPVLWPPAQWWAQDVPQSVGPSVALCTKGSAAQCLVLPWAAAPGRPSPSKQKGHSP